MFAAPAITATLAVGGTIFGATKLLDRGDPTEPGPGALGVRFTPLTLDGDVGGTTGSCWSSGGYDDFGPNMDIRTLDQDNKLTGAGNTSPLDALAEDQPEFLNTINLGDRDLDDDTIAGCEVAALVPLRSGADIHRVEIGRRGETTYTREELEENDWRVQLTLGP